MTRNKFKKVVGIILSATMVLSLAMGVPQKAKAEEGGEATNVFLGATEVGNRPWTKGEETHTVYTNNIGSKVPQGDDYPARGPAKIELNKPYMTRMAKTINYGSFNDPGPMAYYYFTLEKAAKVTIYGKTSEDANSQMNFEKMSSTDSSFEESVNKIGMIKNTNKVKEMNAYLSAGSYLIQLSWGSTYPLKDCSQYSYVRVDADYEINKDTDDEWYQTFPAGLGKNYEPICDPYQIGKKMNCFTHIGDNTKAYPGYFSFHLDKKAEFSLTDAQNVFSAYVTVDRNTVYVDKKSAVLEAGDYIMCVSAKTGVDTYSFNTTVKDVTMPVVAGVDTMAEAGYKIEESNVTLSDINVDGEESSEFCIWSGDADNAGYGKGTVKLVVSGTCYIKTFVIDCPVEITCEPGATLKVGELVINTTEGANGKLTYADNTIYDEKTKTFGTKCVNHNTFLAGEKYATCTAEGYTGDETCSICGTVVKSGSKTEALGHKWDNGKVTKEPTVSEEGVKTFTCTNSGCKETKTEAIAKLPEPKKDEVIEDKTDNDYKVTDPAKKEVTYKAPVDNKDKTITIPASVEINGVTYKVTKIDDKAFKGNTTVTKVVIPSSVTEIGAEAFSGCKKLTTVSVPKNITKIGKNAFKGCAKLTKVTLPSKCTKIGANAFNGCKKMKTITIKSTKLTSKSVSANAFKGLSKNVTIKVPKKQLKAYKKLLKKKGFKGKVKA